MDSTSADTVEERVHTRSERVKKTSLQCKDSVPHLIDARIMLHNLDHFGVNQNKDAARDPEQSVRERREP